MKTKRILILLVVFCFFASIMAQRTTAQNVPDVTGKWNAATRLPDKNVNEEWTIKQTGDKVSGTVKRDNADLPFEGTIDDAGFFRVDLKSGDMVYKVRASLDADTKKTMDGSITIGGKEYIWGAKLSN